jgi:hypothetical protein
MPKLLPGIVACKSRRSRLGEFQPRGGLGVLKLRTEGGQEVLLPLSERATKQVQKVISAFNRSRDLLFVEERPAAVAPLQ